MIFNFLNSVRVSKKIIYEPWISYFKCDCQLHLTLRNHISLKGRLRRNNPDLTKCPPLGEDYITWICCISNKLIGFFLSNEYKTFIEEFSVVRQINTSNNRNAVIDIVACC